MYTQAIVIWKNKRVKYFDKIEKMGRISKYDKNVALIVYLKDNCIQEYRGLSNNGYYYHLGDWFVNIRDFNVEYVAIHYTKRINIIRYSDLRINEVDNSKVVQVSYFDRNMNHLGTVKMLISDIVFSKLLISEIDAFHSSRYRVWRSDKNKYKSGLGYKAGR